MEEVGFLAIIARWETARHRARGICTEASPDNISPAYLYDILLLKGMEGLAVRRYQRPCLFEGKTVMDVQTIEQTYIQLQQQAQQTAQALQALGSKMQTAVQSGDMQAREWSLDLRELALAFQAEQQQVTNLLQQLHAALSNAQPDDGTSTTYQAPTQQIPVQPVQALPDNNFISDILNSGFARSVEAGAGFSIGNDLIKEIF